MTIQNEYSVPQRSTLYRNHFKWHLLALYPYFMPIFCLHWSSKVVCILQLRLCGFAGVKKKIMKKAAKSSANINYCKWCEFQNGTESTRKSSKRLLTVTNDWMCHIFLYNKNVYIVPGLRQSKWIACEIIKLALRFVFRAAPSNQAIEIYDLLSLVFMLLNII